MIGHQRIRKLICNIPFMVSPSALLRTGLSNLAIGEPVDRVASGDLWRHERPFDILPQKDRVNGIKAIFRLRVKEDES